MGVFQRKFGSALLKSSGAAPNHWSSRFLIPDIPYANLSLGNWYSDPSQRFHSHLGAVRHSDATVRTRLATFGCPSIVSGFGSHLLMRVANGLSRDRSRL
jgi:hypothetical protein